MYTNIKFEKIYSSYSYKIYQLFVLVMNINCGMNSIDNVYVNNLKKKFLQTCLIGMFVFFNQDEALASFFS